MGAERFWSCYVHNLQSGELKHFDIKDLEAAFLQACRWMHGGKLYPGWWFDDPLPDAEVEIHLELCTMGCTYINGMELDLSLHDDDHMCQWDPALRKVEIPRYIKDQILNIRRKYLGGI